MTRTNMNHSIVGKAARFVARDVVFDVIRFPMWWYTTGTANAARFVAHELLSVIDRLSIRILIRNFFKPMYGDYTRSGRIISFFMRLVMFVFKLAGLIVWTILLCAAFLLWLSVIPVAIYQIVLQIRG